MARLLLLALVILFTNIAYSQTRDDELATLRTEFAEKYSSKEFVNINDKISLYVNDLSLKQLSDTSKANNKEKRELENLVTLRNNYGQAVDSVILKDVKPADLAKELVNSRISFRTKQDALTAELYNKKISFGEYNQKRQVLATDATSNEQSIKSKFKTNQQVAQPKRSLPKVLIGSSVSKSEGFTVYLYTSSCDIGNIEETYPYYAYIDGSQKMNICYRLDQNKQEITFYVPRFAKSVTHSYAEFNFDRNHVNDAFAHAKSLAQPHTANQSNSSNDNGFISSLNQIANALDKGAKSANPPGEKPLEPLTPSVIKGSPIKYSDTTEKSYRAPQSSTTTNNTSRNCVTLYQNGYSTTQCN